MINARLDHKTRTRVLCGAEHCRGEFGILYYPKSMMLSDPPGMRPPDGAVPQEHLWPGHFLEKCPRCGAENAIDLQLLMDIQRLVFPPPDAVVN